MEKITGYIDHIIFRNEDNGYTVMVLICGGEEVTCVGTFQYVGEGEILEAEGSYAQHGTYGRQFKISSYTWKTPQDELAMERYLGSGAIRGVGAALAARIVQRFREDTFRIIEEEPERLAEIRGISQRKAMEIAEQMEEKRGMQRAMLFLQQYGISGTLAVKIYNTYGTALYQIVQENPYRLADDISGVGFRIADGIASRAGVPADSEYRVRSALLYVLSQATGEGHVYLPKEELLRRTAELLGIAGEEAQEHLPNLAMERRIVLKDDAVYIASNYYLELNTAKMLHDLNLSAETEEEAVKERIRRIEQETGITLEDLQKKAVAAAAGSGLLVITGGPGTGKTTTINALIRYFEEEGLTIRLAAPTGRAAKRMTETTGCEAQTIHRLLEVSGGPQDEKGPTHFERNMENPLEADVIIIDEMSMVDIFLMHALLLAVTPGTRLIMVGDVNQLPSVGAGCVLRDIIRSERIPVVRLNRIFRQASESDIVVNAHKINSGEHMKLDNNSRDFFFLRRDDADVIIRVLLTLIQHKLPPYVKAKPYDIQVLTAMRKGLLGVERLNSILQRYLNPPSPQKREYEHAGGLFREGDKVMQIRNNYQIVWERRGAHGIAAESGTGVFNGDMGIVREINAFAQTLTVEFDEARFVTYAFKELDELELAYAITIHKSQGSEYPAVLIPILAGPKLLMNRNLLYTAVTRARRCVTLVGSPEVFYQMIDNRYEQKRYTTLCERICEWND